MRLFYAALALEANTFLPIPTSYQAFVEKIYYPPGKHPEKSGHQTGAIAAARAAAKHHGFELIEGSCYAAQPGGPASREAYERMRDEILGQLKAAMPVDGCLFNLHGAMVAHGYDDCEGDLLERVRAIVGPKAVIGVELDPHCHLTKKRCAAADIIVLFKEYPHTDFAERGEEMVDLTLRTIRGEIKPVKSVYDCRVIQSFPTSIQPMRGLVDKIMALEGKNRVLSVSIAHCFYYGDAPECGARILVLTDDAKPHGDKLAEEIGQELIALREQAAPPEYTVDAAIDAALAHPGGPTVIADTTDNAGGGAPSDNTTFIHRLIARGVQGAAVAPIWDPMAVRNAFDAGEGAKLAVPFRRQDREVLRATGRCRSRDHPLRAQCLSVVLRRNRRHRRCRLDPHGRRLGGADHDAFAGHGRRSVLEPRHRPEAAENPGGEVEPAFLRVVLADRRASALRGR